jgi:hypothetical protein
MGETFPIRILKHINGLSQKSLRTTVDDEFIQRVSVHYYKYISRNILKLHQKMQMAPHVPQIT